jgi:Flp pilus assembly protein TadD
MKFLIFTFFVFGPILFAPLSSSAQAGYSRHTNINEDPSNLDAKAAKLVESGRYREAAAVYVRLIELYPSDADLYVDLSRCRLELREFHDAVRYARTAVKLDPTNFAARNNLGWGLVSLGDIETGIDELKNAIRIKPDIEPIRTNLGLAFLKIGRDREAITELQTALALDPYSIRAKTALAIAYKRAGWHVLA